MIKHVKRLSGYYLTLLILSIILFVPIFWVYRFFRVSFGNEAALISLAITIIIVMVFAIRVAVHTHRITRNLRREIRNTGQHGKIVSLVFRIFKIVRSKPNDSAHEKTKSPDKASPFPQQFMTFSKKHRGKQPRFPEEKIRKTVLRWESRDPSFSVAR